MTDRHPMDDVPMRMASIVVDGLWEEVYIPPTQEELRAERIAAYELGRNAVLKEFAEAFEQEAEKASDHVTKSLLMGMANRIRKTLKR